MSKLTKHFRNSVITGLLILVPLVITYLILRLVLGFLDGILQPGIEAIFGREVYGLGLVTLIVLVYLTGIIGINFLGKKVINWVQQLVLRVPLVKFIYSGAKELIESFSGERTTGLKRVVIIEYPRAGAWTIGFLTSQVTDEIGNILGLVYIPTAPTPNSGWVAILPIAQIYDTDLSVSVAMRLVLSGGIVAPPQIRKTASPA